MTLADRPNSSFRRHLLGAFGVICLTVGIYFYVWPPELASVEFLQGSCVKAGLVLMAAWLAFPQLDRLPGWLFAVFVGFLLAVATRPKIVMALMRFAIFLAPVFILIWLLRPKAKRGSTR